MSENTVLNEIITALAGISGDYPIHLADFLNVDAEGQLQLPDEDEQFVLYLITGTPTHEWDSVRYRDVRVQLNAWSNVEGNATVMLQAAEDALVAINYRPLVRRSLGRDGGWTGAAQDFERTTT